MNIKVALIQIVAIILFNALRIEAECNVCSADTQMACVSETEYQFCINDIPSGAISSCPTNYICSTTTSVICLPEAAGVTASCSNCNKCDLNLIFACTGVNTYALCSGTTSPTGASGTCAAGQVCNVNNAQICVSSTTSPATCPTGGITSTTTTSTTTTTTIAPVTPSLPTTVPTYAQYFCSVMQINTRFQVPTEFDNTCKRYIYCFKTRQGNWSGQVYTCAGSTYFDPQSKYCIATRPSTC